MMLDKLLEDCVNKFRPQIVNAGDTAIAHSERIISELMMIRAEVADEEFIELRKRFNPVLTAGTEIDLSQVASNRTWILEAVTVPGACTIVINEGGLVRYAGTFTGAKTEMPPPIVFFGGSAITVLATTNASPITCYLQFKVRHTYRARPTVQAGMIERPIDPNDSSGRQDLDHRHGSALRFQPNVIGNGKMK